MGYTSTIRTILLVLFVIGLSYHVVSVQINSNTIISSTRSDIQASMATCGVYAYGPVYVPYILGYSDGTMETQLAIMDYNSNIASAQTKLNNELTTNGYSTITFQPQTLITAQVIPLGFPASNSAQTGVYPILSGNTYQGVRIDTTVFDAYFSNSANIWPFFDLPAGKNPSNEMLFMVKEATGGANMLGGYTDLDYGYIIMSTDAISSDAWIHEVGHSLGLDDHTIDPNNIMFETGSASPLTFYPQQACAVVARMCNPQLKPAILGVISGGSSTGKSVCDNGLLGYDQTSKFEQCEANLVAFGQPCLDCNAKPIPQVPPASPSTPRCKQSCECKLPLGPPWGGSPGSGTTGGAVVDTGGGGPNKAVCGNGKPEQGEECGEPGLGPCTGVGVKCIKCKCKKEQPPLQQELCDNDPAPGCQNPKFMQTCGSSQQEDGTIVYAYCDYDCGCKYGI